jgi:hypothetical protein
MRIAGRRFGLLMIDMVVGDAIGAGIVVNHRLVVFGVSRRLGS